MPRRKFLPHMGWERGRQWHLRDLKHWRWMLVVQDKQVGYLLACRIAVIVFRVFICVASVQIIRLGDLIRILVFILKLVT